MNNDKVKIQEILNELTNLKNYSNDLANNIRGEKLENYTDSLNKNINILDNKTENIYENNYKTGE